MPEDRATDDLDYHHEHSCSGLAIISTNNAVNKTAMDSEDASALVVANDIEASENVAEKTAVTDDRAFVPPSVSSAATLEDSKTNEMEENDSQLAVDVSEPPQDPLVLSEETLLKNTSKKGSSMTHHADSESASHVPSKVSTPSQTPLQASILSPASGNAQLDLVRDQLLALSRSNKLDKVDSKRLSLLINDYDCLKDKVTKIKSLLGRSAKAQREAKVELEVTQKRLDQSLREVDRLHAKIDKLANRPTHMELLADFETNFDRALLSVHRSNTAASSSSSNQQTGGQDTAPPHYADDVCNKDSNNFMDALLLQEVQDAKARIDKLETLNQGLLQRCTGLEDAAQQSKRERDELQRQVQHLELEKRMAVMEADQASRALQDKTASLEEMELELNLVTKASRSARARAEQEQERVQHAKTDRQHVIDLESQVAALQEWALAANEAKSLAQERVRLLETQLRTLQSSNSQSRNPNSALENSAERILFSKPGSLVVGAGERTCTVVELSADDVKSAKHSERVILRWRFDLVQDDAQIDFSILKSKCETKLKQKSADYLVKDRLVVGGAAGEMENAFAIQNSCTLLWSNSKAWIRPKTVRFNVEAVAIED